MKKLAFIFVFVGILGCSFEQPQSFSESALKDVMLDVNGSELAFEEILNQNKGKTLMIDLWAGWCKDCIESIPEINALQQEYPEVVWVFLSLDRSVTAWQNSMRNYQLKGQHYFIRSGWDGPFCDAIRMNWIPRYMVINPDGSIKLFKATKITSSKLKNALL